MKSLSKSLRLAGKDYSEPGWYFVTLGADFHQPLFGRMEGVKVRLNTWGRIVAQAWKGLETHYALIEAREFIVMPNHVHGLIRLRPGNEVALGQIVNGFKAQVTREVNKQEGWPCVVWQKNYHEVVVHGLAELKAKVGYIRENPARWGLKDLAKARQTLAASWRCLGNQELLKAEKKWALRVSRTAGVDSIEDLKERMRKFDGVVASTFFSPGERACLRVLLEEGRRAKIIWVLPMGMPSQIFAQWADAFVTGRALWLSAYPDEAREASRERCVECNGWVGRMAECEGVPGLAKPSPRRGRTWAGNRACLALARNLGDLDQLER